MADNFWLNDEPGAVIRAASSKGPHGTGTPGRSPHNQRDHPSAARRLPVRRFSMNMGHTRRFFMDTTAGANAACVRKYSRLSSNAPARRWLR